MTIDQAYKVYKMVGELTKNDKVILNINNAIDNVSKIYGGQIDFAGDKHRSSIVVGADDVLDVLRLLQEYYYKKKDKVIEWLLIWWNF